LGGFISRERSRDRDGVPGLSEVPVLGNLFGVKRDYYRETELAIFVTPVVVNADHPGMTQRVEKAAVILDQAFGTEARLNTPIQSSPTSSTWHQRDAAHSQWESEKSSTHETQIIDQWSETP
jgi:type II secretory pathway component GspD/PulD (secretin)